MSYLITPVVLRLSLAIGSAIAVPTSLSASIPTTTPQTQQLAYHNFNINAVNLYYSVAEETFEKTLELQDFVDRVEEFIEAEPESYSFSDTDFNPMSDY